ncbi:MAG TPA: hypothetical protein DEG17_11135 [Cyanobacteria bacterium UBA11149]|nr:hypothetical protein [Cyanobacteria bacterium UBA11367]HBE60283.1 hypothetical protein [Cyanobacteria bacterium UBA11366]HBK62555.1 hypothetical protein [Cyanobacteria bacterium UBA11166]HBR77069.1 hypothetical protein [Cyanobacteria bacterium UBA11159]HBS71412.1 hypothetical protein [Cyanobacteria bacterium UBA11153]HBW89403.1 hypothetical protein [Cyanobacteria bacterium UBA11149]HCA93525.1 hypothetical protein [Cyanobacteria bacterium UBA9226]
MKFPPHLKAINVVAACLTAASIAIAVPVPSGLSQTIQAEDIEHLSCTKQGQKLICDIETMDSQTAPSRSPSEQQLSVPTRTYLLSPNLDEKLANILLGISFIGLPVGLILLILWFDKHAAEQDSQLQSQIEALERIWNQTSQS